ncbi:MAG: hypothetical protein ATN33_07235 [Epulopiscium sp. Nele67-Bin001]|nr:MAG: hypothetical protein BEN18_10865 [Epulopiscium sp. Nuni2H_MBin001]OON92486.1 MAG: hypothetical protein ATN33_07235 [Epulopiscium sp. Nele67-Bin001]
MNVIERRNIILTTLNEANTPIPAKEFANLFGVTRQVIVQDISILKATHSNILSTNLGYVIQKSNKCTKEFWVCHSDERTIEELNLIVDLGGVIKDVSIDHEFYGKITVSMNITSRKSAQEYDEGLKTKNYKNLCNSTGGYHYHLIEADDEETLALIERTLKDNGFIIADIVEDAH